jgi:hypothetical protein
MSSSSLSGAFSAFAPGAGLSMMNNGINYLDQEIVWISVDEPGEIDDIRLDSELVLYDIEEPESLEEIGGADDIPQEAHYERNPRIDPFKSRVDIPSIETESTISSNPETC